MKWRIWFKGLVSALIGGASTAVTTMIVSPAEFNLDGGLEKVGMVAAVSAIVSAANYLKKSPMPDTVLAENEEDSKG